METQLEVRPDPAQAGPARPRRVACTAALALALSLGGLLAVAGADVSAQTEASPVGLWRNIDDETKQPKALIRIAEQGGVLSGRIEKILTDKTDAVCDLCTDERKDRPVQGMTIIEGMRRSAEEPDLYEGGRILDPNNGKVYRSRMRLVGGGRQLEVRGYIGAPLFGRTQTWIREP